VDIDQGLRPKRGETRKAHGDTHRSRIEKSKQNQRTRKRPQRRHETPPRLPRQCHSVSHGIAGVRIKQVHHCRSVLPILKVCRLNRQRAAAFATAVLDLRDVFHAFPPGLWQNPPDSNGREESMPRLGSTLSNLGFGVFRWLTRYVGWLMLTTAITLTGASVLLLLRDWTFKTLFTSMMAWPALGLGMLFAVPIAFIGVGRIYFFSALGCALVYNLVLLFS
jgi:hypothetical protein